MNSLAPVGRFFFAAALVAWGVEQFVVGDFVVGRAPAFPAAMPGRLVWAYGTGVVFIAAGAALASGRRAWLAGVVSGVLIFVWALLREIPEAAAGPALGVMWTAAGKSLTFFGGVLAVAASVRGVDDGSGNRSWFREIGTTYFGRACLGVFMVICGIQHFLFSDFVAQLVPAWIPGQTFWAYFAGVALIAGGAGLFVPPIAPTAGLLSGLMVFTWFLILHIPRAVAADSASRRNEWTAVFESLAVAGIALVVAQRPRSRAPSARDEARLHASVSDVPELGESVAR